MVSSIIGIFGKYGPQYLILALVVVAMWQSGALKAVFTKRPPTVIQPQQQQSEFVLRSDCHRHVDSLKDEIKEEFREVRSDLKELRGIMVRHIEQEGKA